MLVLSRKIDEKVMIEVPGLDGTITLTVVKIERSKVRMGIDAPQCVSVLRHELCTNAKERIVRKAAKVAAF